MSACPDSGDGWHYWVPELVPRAFVFDASPELQVQPLPIFAVCRFCGEVQ